MFLVAKNLIVAIAVGWLAPAAAMAQSAQSWEQILVAAKKEGMVSVIGPQGSETRDALTLVFQKKYPDIRVDLQSMAGNQIGPKLFNELAAGRNTTDLLITGTTTALETLLPAKALVHTWSVEGGANISMCTPRGDRLHLSMQVRTLPR